MDQKKADTWHAYDVIADRISLVRNYRSQFTRIIHDSSYPEFYNDNWRLPSAALSETIIQHTHAIYGLTSQIDVGL
ncbi:MAG: ABC transporter substrate-binding protein [Nitrospiraceae bacterium]